MCIKKTINNYNVMTTDLRQEIKRDLKLRDKANEETKILMSIERTSFANIRTFLSFVRTSLSLIIAAFALHQYFNTTLSMLFGIVLVPAALVIGYMGYFKFAQKRNLINSKRKNYIPAKEMLVILKADKTPSMQVSHTSLAETK